MKNVCKILFLMFLCGNCWADFPDSCPKMSQPNNCDFYEKCLEAKNQCGNEGYAIGYGQKYCRAFNSLDLSPQGEKWITATMACLQENLIPYAEDKTDCKVIKDSAFQSHVNCYVNSGFCDLSNQDKLKIMKTNIWSLITSLEGLNEGVKTLVECSKQ